ncbi:UDP-N-acetylmuramoyl-L-alanine--D-glutamate ligase [Schaalia sp. JY-X169]|uniref:UDP-N-acetylmuramoyl-L-alanine--D-glutamate ligase n=1 Tax=Schaalia sp. JY-X169 TaxID=2758572 RepID=UPI0015F7768A|nr:UDP-N-acetylmuramoyl-L-alanine--D-glutamate ligase [Schaalia sp. JY-X169]
MTHPKAAVVGLGVSGRAAVELLYEDGYEVTVFDQSATEAPESLRECLTSVVVIADPVKLGEAICALEPAVVVLSPGVPGTSPIASIPQQRGIDVIGEVELAYRHRSLQPGGAKWLAVTGTNGKTTTVGMVEAILRAAHVDAIQTGNVGYPVAKAVAEGHEVLVAELSSFQLATTATLAPWASICLNVDSDHLDWHGNVAAYRAAKARVYDRVRKARFAFADDEVTAEMAVQCNDCSDSSLVPLTFGVVASGDIGIADGFLIDFAFIDSPEDEPVIADLRQVPLLSGALTRLDGASSPLVRDALAAAALARSLGVSGEDIVAGLQTFQMAPHRYALVPTGDGRYWVDDSKATNVHAARAALNNVVAGTAVWIVGGDAKGQDLSALIAEAAKDVKAAVVIGAEQEGLLELFKRYGPDLPVVSVPGMGPVESWMKDAVRACGRIAEVGDTVLLAPACASWDQFASYSQRGDVFREAVTDVVGGKG